MQLIGMLDSPYVRRVAISLAVLEIPFTHRPVSVFRDFEIFRAINPVVKAPTLVTDDGTVLMDSTLILDHIESALPVERRLMPQDAGQGSVPRASLASPWSPAKRRFRSPMKPNCGHPNGNISPGSIGWVPSCAMPMPRSRRKSQRQAGTGWRAIGSPRPISPPRSLGDLRGASCPMCWHPLPCRALAAWPRAQRRWPPSGPGRPTERRGHSSPQRLRQKQPLA
jgi:hypothetical protein